MENSWIVPQEVKHRITSNSAPRYPPKRIKSKSSGTSLVIQWLRLHLPMQQVWVQSLVGELITHVSWPRNNNTRQKQHCIKFNKDLKKKTPLQTKAFTWIQAALLTTAKKLRQSKCLSMETCINKRWYIHMKVYYSSIKRHEVLIVIHDKP